MKKLFTLPNLIYLCGIVILISKTKSRCTPPKTFHFDTSLYSTNDVNNNKNDANATVTSARPQHRIPRIIHQSYKSIPLLMRHHPEWSHTPDRWKALHPSPTYQYMFWSDADNRKLIQEHYPWFLNSYDAYSQPIQRADAARYFAVLKYGGIYADMDILPRRDVSPLLDQLDNWELHGDKEMIVAETYNLGLTNALFASIPNSTILNQFVKELPFHTRPLHGLEMVNNHFHVLLSAGPTRLWIFLNQHRDKIVTLNPAGWGQCHQCRDHSKTCIPQKGAFFETRQGGSWHKWDTRVMNFLLCHAHFCVWGGICALMCLYQFWSRKNENSAKFKTGYLGRAWMSSSSSMHSNNSEDEAVGLVPNPDSNAQQQKHTKKYRPLSTCNIFILDQDSNSEQQKRYVGNVIFLLRQFCLQHRLSIFGVVVLMLVF